MIMWAGRLQNSIGNKNNNNLFLDNEIQYETARQCPPLDVRLDLVLLNALIRMIYLHLLPFRKRL